MDKLLKKVNILKKDIISETYKRNNFLFLYLVIFSIFINLLFIIVIQFLF